ncbi:pyridoxamine 5'-phosphate oxidase family protein [Vulcanococcus limneticus]|uniref:pyridoxamine 5'-phosphate oxidase family protein n=1 Tax=Vulcanococcus limneticus TaxID=2170428 RepID=UPI00398BDB36
MSQPEVSQDLPPWRPLLKAARQREGRAPQARWLQLATVATDGSPRLRTLVFRGWAGPAQLDLLTDGRSSKASQLQADPRVELGWLLPKARSQFRLRGRRLELEAEALEAARRQHWQQLTPSGRALWGWPAPGTSLQPETAFPLELADDTPMPEHFELLRIDLSQVELLELSGSPHRLRRWRAAEGWTGEELNP